LNETIVKRRLDMVKKRGMGLPLRDVVSELHTEYGVTKTWLYHDWQQRDKWLPLVMDVEDANLAYWDIVAFHNRLKELAMLQYLKSDNSSAAVGAINSARQINLDLSKLLVVRSVLERLDRLENKH
jgi:hypothetical protein